MVGLPGQKKGPLPYSGNPLSQVLSAAGSITSKCIVEATNTIGLEILKAILIIKDTHVEYSRRVVRKGIKNKQFGY
jgi:hypothetical protein